jgi:hypothetical protein
VLVVALLGVISVKVVGASPRLGDYVGNLLQDLVTCGTNASVSGSVVPGDVALDAGSSSVVGPGVSRLCLPGSPSFFAIAHQLEAGGGRGRVRMLIGHHHGDVARDAVLGPPEHPAPDSI